jgi:RNA polymerase sigma factor (sigma-70 family)
MKDYYATLKIQQGRLKAAMQELGIESAYELSRRSKVSRGYIGKMLNFKLSPRGDNGEWREATLLICKALGSEPNDLFPEHLQHEIPTNRIASFVEHAQLSGSSTRQLGPGDECERAEMETTVDEVLHTLSDRERSVLKERFWDGKTLKQIGKEQNVSGNAIRVMEARALRKLRHPTRLRKLEDVCTFA